MSGEKIAHELINILSVLLRVESRFLLAAMRDRASVNIAAIRVVSVVYPTQCFRCRVLLSYIGSCSRLLYSAHSLQRDYLFSRSALKQKPFGRSKQDKLWPHTAKRAGRVDAQFYTNWWYNLVILPFLRRNEDIGPALWPKPLEMVTNVQSLANPKAWIGCSDWYRWAFCKVHLLLGRDEPLVFIC